MAGRSRRVTVRAPGSIANLGPGFDVFGLALREPFDLLTAETTEERAVQIRMEGTGAGAIPLEPERNTAGRVAKLLVEKFDLDIGFRITIQKGIRSGFGLGSSGADAAAAAYALNRLTGLGLSDGELVELAAEGEVAASDAAHADNVSASLLGGFTIVRSYHPLDILSLEPPSNLGVCIAIPHIAPPERKTALARGILPEKVTLGQLTHNIGHAASLVYGLLTGDVAVIGRAMNDGVVEPIRSRLIPGYEQVRSSALKCGAAGVVICGAGPSIAAFFDAEACRPGPILESMAGGFRAAGVEPEVFCTAPGKGVRVVEGG